MKKMNRRKFVKDSLKVTALTAVGTTMLMDAEVAHAELPALSFTQIPLPYAFNALEPNIDAMTMEIHYTKHHAAYIKNVNEAITAESISFGSEKDFFSNISKVSAKARNNAMEYIVENCDSTGRHRMRQLTHAVATPWRSALPGKSKSCFRGLRNKTTAICRRAKPCPRSCYLRHWAASTAVQAGHRS